LEDREGGREHGEVFDSLEKDSEEVGREKGGGFDETFSRRSR
jgi:hypothetical protein